MFFFSFKYGLMNLATFGGNIKYNNNSAIFRNIIIAVYIFLQIITVTGTAQFVKKIV